MPMTERDKMNYRRKYNEGAYDRVGLYLPKGKDGEPGMKEVWQRAADRAGESLGEYIKTAVNERIDRDKENIFERVTYSEEEIQAAGKVAGA